MVIDRSRIRQVVRITVMDLAFDSKNGPKRG